MKLRDPYLKIHQPTKEICCGFTDNAVNIISKPIVPFFSNGWEHEECLFFMTESHERIIFGSDNSFENGDRGLAEAFLSFTDQKDL